MRLFWATATFLSIVVSTQAHADDSALSNADIVLEHLESVTIANVIKKDFPKHVKHLASDVAAGIQENGQGPVKYANGPGVVEGMYDVITSDKKHPFSATCQKTATDEGPLEDLVMCYLSVPTDWGTQAKVQMFYGLKKGKIDRVIMANVGLDDQAASTDATKPAGQN
ncbi:MAG TPA: hypothetical protein VJ811_01675 [Sphingopyxis sp.]|nr:hypothetical protein [Sphingopyxis sp.]